MKITRMIRETLLWIGGLTLLALIVAYLAGAFREKTPPGEVAAPAPAAPAFGSVGLVEQVAEPLIERVPGTLSAVRDATISSRIMAAIGEVAVRAGDRVERGQVLVQLDSRDLAAREAQARQAVQAAQARLTDAQREYDRLQKLVADGIVPRAQFDTAEADLTAAKAALAGAGLAVEEAAAGRSFATLTAPIGGRVVDRYAEPGDTAMPGQALLRVYDPSRMRIEADVRESLAAALKPGQSIPVHVEALGADVEGRVEEIVPQSDPGSRSVRVKVALPQRDDLYPGMFGRLMIPAGRTERLYAPTRAIHRVGQLTYVWVVASSEDDAESAPSRRFVKLGEHLRDGQVEVLSGLRAGERLALPQEAG
jgi:RND family efflux transporter MFP subunit